MKNLNDYLSSEYSWWILTKDNEIQPLNLTVPNGENIRIIFHCSTCSAENETPVFHVIELKEIKKSTDEDYDACCPLDKKGENQAYIGRYEIPDILLEFFKTTSFEQNY